MNTICKEKNISAGDDYQRLERISDDFLKGNKDGNVESIIPDKKRKKLLLYIKHSPHKNVRSQEIVENMLGMKNPVFDMAREKVLFKSDEKLT